MRRSVINLVPVLALCLAAVISGRPAHAQDEGPTDAEIRQLMVQASIATYSSACPCPESVDRSGSRCGDRSAYRRGGGDRPLCYPSDVSDEMVSRYRERLPKE